MSDQSIFQGTDQVPQGEAPQSTPTTSLPPELSELVGEGKKYSNVEAALKSLPHAQSHISKLEAELAELRTEVQKRKTTQELLDEIKSGIPQGETAPKEGLNQDAVAKLVEQVITQKRQQETATVNAQKVVSAFRETFGEQAEAQYQKLAAEAGLPMSEMNRLAATSPLAVLKLAGITKQTTTPTPGKVSSDVNTIAMGGQPNTELSAKVKGSSTKDVVAAWRIAGEKVRKSLENS